MSKALGVRVPHVTGRALGVVVIWLWEGRKGFRAGKSVKVG